MIQQRTFDQASEIQLTHTRVNQMLDKWPEVAPSPAGLPEKEGDTFKIAYTIYDYFPFLIYPDYPTVEEEKVRLLTQALRLYIDYLVAADHAIDSHYEHVVVSEKTVLRSNLLHAEALHIFYHLFPPTHAFWADIEQVKHAYLSALCSEVQYRSLPASAFSVEKAELIAHGKIAFLQLAPIALAHLSGVFDRHEALNHSIFLSNVGNQFYDDLRDWKKDFLSGQPSLLVSELCRSLGWHELPVDKEERRKSLAHLSLHMYRSGLALAHVNQCTHYYARALASLQELPSPPLPADGQMTWRGLLGHYERAMQDLALYIEAATSKGHSPEESLRKSAV